MTTSKRLASIAASFVRFLNLRSDLFFRKKNPFNSPEEIVAAAELQARAFYTSYPLGPLDALMFYQFRV